MRLRPRFIALSLLSLLLCVGLSACQKNVAPHQLEGSSLSIGVAPFVQPLTRVDLLAGYIPEKQERVTPEQLAGAGEKTEIGVAVLKLGLKQ